MSSLRGLVFVDRFWAVKKLLGSPLPLTDDYNWSSVNWSQGLMYFLYISNDMNFIPGGYKRGRELVNSDHLKSGAIHQE